MLTKLHIRRFKRFDDVSIELGNPVVFIGPNDSGKTSALQALALWEVGVKRWFEKRGDASSVPKKRSGVAINRKDLLATPVPDARLLWNGTAVRTRAKQVTQNVRIDLVVEGLSNGAAWKCGFEFDYANEESFHCRPLRQDDGEWMPVPPEARDVQIAYLPPMSGLASNETRLDPGAINVRLGEGRTAEVLRNLCHQIYLSESQDERWSLLVKRLTGLFGARLDPPKYIPERGEVSMSYTDPGGTALDLSCSGRGMQQTLLVLCHLLANPQSVLLLDEPDAHLEILRQRQVYDIISEMAAKSHGQVIAASHSEVVLNEAADRDVVVAFVGQPHRIDGRGSQVLKALRDIGFDQYYKAELTGWVLYFEGATDLAILQAFAKAAEHPVSEALERPFVHYVGNDLPKAYGHFFGLREAKQDLRGIAIFDNLGQAPEPKPGLVQHCWTMREIENYLCQEETLLRWAGAEGEGQQGALFGETWRETMQQAIAKTSEALHALDKPSPWAPDCKVSDDFLTPLFKNFYQALGLPNQMQKTNFHRLAAFVTHEMLDPEVLRLLDTIGDVAGGGRGTSASKSESEREENT